jgi:hypothetical protein
MREKEDHRQSPNPVSASAVELDRETPKRPVLPLSVSVALSLSLSLSDTRTHTQEQGHDDQGSR